MKLAHVLFTDIVGYSKLPVEQQTALLRQLQEVVRATQQFARARSEERLISLPTGDGMALVFFDDPEAPVRCALAIGAALKQSPEIKLRMGVHSGPVDRVLDINGNVNVTGAGINMAQRVMDCGDAGHILVSARVADDLWQFSRWRPYLHDLGEVAVKHGVHVHVFNLYTDEAGNPEVPQKLAQASPRRDKRRVLLRAAAVLVFAVLLAGALWRGLAPKGDSTSKGTDQTPPSTPDEPPSAEGERELTYWLTVQKMRNGRPYQQPFESSGLEIFEDGWQFWLNISTQQSGYLYLLGEAPRAEGEPPRYRVLYPYDGGPALVAAKNHFIFPRRNESGYFFDDKHGTEKIWLVWAMQPVTALEAVKRAANPADEGVVTDRVQSDEVEVFITRHSEPVPRVEKDPAGTRTTVNARGDLMVALLELKHH